MQLPDPEKPSPAPVSFLPEMHEVKAKQNTHAMIIKDLSTVNLLW
jgi:hypothetical protein